MKYKTYKFNVARSGMSKRKEKRKLQRHTVVKLSMNTDRVVFSFRNMALQDLKLSKRGNMFPETFVSNVSQFFH